MTEVCSQHRSFSGDRMAVVVKSGDEFEVEFYRGEDLVERRSMRGHNQMYAEDAAENWCNDVIHIKGSWA